MFRRFTTPNPRTVVVTTVQILCFTHVFFSRIAEPRPCGGLSMYPTLPDRSVVVLTTPLFLHPLTRGSFVTYPSPLDPSNEVLKRVVGLEGDLIRVDPSGEKGNGGEAAWVRVTKGHVWCVGDNTSNSTDSRDYGPVPAGLVRARAVAMLWPKPTWFETGLKEVESE